MRTREEIESRYKLVYTIENDILEVLIDIRELLQKSTIKKDKNGTHGSYN